MKFNVHLTAFTDTGQIRQVEVPDKECKGNTESVLNRIYWHGQNEAQPQKIRSVSAGDAIEYQNHLHLILLTGFLKISKKQLDNFTKLNPAQKIKYLIKMEKK
jgi:hypothetical protein